MKKRALTSSLLLLALLAQAPAARAMYSPVINNSIQTIRGDVGKARTLNGTGSIMDAADKVAGYDTTRRQLDPNAATGLCAGYANFTKKIKDGIVSNLSSAGNNFIYSFWLLLGDWGGWIRPGQGINACLRNDIMELMSMKDAVAEAGLKAGILCDNVNGPQLSDDYDKLNLWLQILNGDIATKNKPYATNPDGTDAYLFGDKTAKNYYGGEPGDCPYGEFTMAFTSLAKSVDNFINVIQNIGDTSNSSGSIWEQAKARAKQRAAQWIKANQLKFTLGGQAGATGGKSLLTPFVGGPDTPVDWTGMWNNVAGPMNAQFNALKAIIGPVTPLFDADLWRGVGSAFSGSACVKYIPDPPAPYWRACYADEAEKFAIDPILCDRCTIVKRSAFIDSVVSDIQKNLEKNTKALSQAQTALKFNLTFNSVDGQSLISLDRELFLMNAEIKRAYTGSKENGQSLLPTFCVNALTLDQKQCGGRTLGTLGISCN